MEQSGMISAAPYVDCCVLLRAQANQLVGYAQPDCPIRCQLAITALLHPENVFLRQNPVAALQRPPSNLHLRDRPLIPFLSAQNLASAHRGIKFHFFR
jgi:hypothetical protein